jgi:hypothetical protein
MSKLLRPLTCTLALLAIATTAGAQPATISVSAEVSTQLTVSGARQLTFPTVYPGFARTIAATDATASGKFSINGGPNANISFTLTLPSNLASGSNNLPISAWTGCRNNQDALTGCSAFVPNASPLGAVIGAGGVYVVFLGATVTAGAAQAAGTYTGTVSMTAAYTGT